MMNTEISFFWFWFYIYFARKLNHLLDKPIIVTVYKFQTSKSWLLENTKG